MLATIQGAKQAEQQTRKEAEQAQQALFALQDDLRTQEGMVAALTREREALQERLHARTNRPVQEQASVPPDLLSRLEALQQVQQVTREREALAQQVARLGEEARTAALKRDEGEQERHIRLNWYRITTSFQASLRSILTAWPSPLDTQAFEADDWHRLSEVKALARRFLAECEALTANSGTMIVESAIVPEEADG